MQDVSASGEMSRRLLFTLPCKSVVDDSNLLEGAARLGEKIPRSREGGLGDQLCHGAIEVI